MSRRNGAHAEGRRRGLVGFAGLAYPGWWRDRYGPEQARLAEDLVAEGRSRLKVAASLVAGGLSVRLTGTGMPPIPEAWADRSKWVLATTLLPVLVGTFAVMTVLNNAWAEVGPRTGLLGRVADDLWQAGMWTNLAVLLTGAAAWHVVYLGTRELDGGRRRLLLAGLLLPFAVVLGLFGLTMLAGNLGAHSVQGGRLTTPGGSTWTHFRSVPDHPLAAAVIAVAEGILGYGGMAGFFVALLVALRTVPTRSWMLGRGVFVGRVVGTGCLLLAVLVGASGALAVHAPALSFALPAPVPSALPWCWWPCVASLVGLGVLAVVGARNAGRCRRVADHLAAAA